ncbi:MAG: SDR family oxidoreductase [Acidimicrobiia bacterium]
MDLGLSGARVAVAAASNGLGFATAQAFVDNGAQVVICGRNERGLTAACERLGPSATWILADVSEPAEATSFVREASARLGGLDVLVTNAGGPPPGRAGEMTIEDYEAAFRLNCLSTIAMCEAALPGMRDQRHGRIVAITSVSVRQPIATLVLSNTARAGATAYLKTLATEVAADGITVNSVQPGFHMTDRLADIGNLDAIAAAVPAKRIGAPEDFGKIVAFLASDTANYITGAALQVDGGAYSGLQ